MPVRHTALVTAAALLSLPAGAALTPGAGSAQTRMASAQGVVRTASATSFRIPEGVRARVQVDHLLLSGTSFREARAALRRLGPTVEEGAPADGLTDYELAPRLTPVSDGARCRAEGVRVDVEVRILLPEWVDVRRAPMEDRRRWNSFLDGLSVHEEAHRDLTLRAAETLDARLRSLEASSCPRLVRRIHGVVTAAEQALAEAHRTLDQKDGRRR